VELVGADFRVGNKVKGDGDGDSRVSAMDALLAMKMAASLVTPDLTLDINGDGVITTEDARAILNMARPS